MKKDIVWKGLEVLSLEHLNINYEKDYIKMDSVIVKEDVPLRIYYEIYCNTHWEVKRVNIKRNDNEVKNICIISEEQGIWKYENGEEVNDLKGCIDIDISATPFTNTLPIKRLSLNEGESRNIRVVYIDVDNFTLKSMKQRYTYISSSLEGCKYKYENLESGFNEEIIVDKDSLVVDYPNLFKRIK